MKVPIPDDWNGEDWQCYQIHWPKSDKWLAQLMGALTLYMRGRYWDERTGSIKAAQAVGEQIWDRNYPPLSCDPAETPPDAPGDDFRDVSNAMGLWDIGACFMPCIDISGLIKVENGQLYVRDSCCDWIAVGSVSGTAANPPLDTPWSDAPGDPPSEFSGCGKARKIVETLRDVVGAMWDNYVNEPWEFWVAMNGAFPEYSLDRVKIFAAWFALNIVQVYMNKSHYVDAWLVERAICLLENDMLDATPTTDAEYDAVRPALKSAAFEKHGTAGFAGELYAHQVASLYDYAADMIGKGDIKTIMNLGALDTAAVCTCPEDEGVLPTPPPEATWHHVFDFTIDEQTFVDPGSTADYIPGVGWRSNEFGGYDVNLNVNGAAKLNNTGQSQTSYLLWAYWAYTCDPWVSGARAHNIKMDSSTPFQAELNPVDGDITQSWNGYGQFTIANGSTPSIRLQIIRDECGPDQYYATISRLEVAGIGYDPFTSPA